MLNFQKKWRESFPRIKGDFVFAVIRVRGNVHMRHEVMKSLAMLGLNRVNRLTIIPESEANKKMLKKIEAYITWGEIENSVLVKALEKRARTSIAKKASLEFLKEKGYNSFEGLAKKIEEGKTLQGVGLKTYIPLKPPSKGYERKGIKKSFSIGGALGYRGKEINPLLERML